MVFKKIGSTLTASLIGGFITVLVGFFYGLPPTLNYEILIFNFGLGFFIVFASVILTKMLVSD